jgi:hypothetical protein
MIEVRSNNLIQTSPIVTGDGGAKAASPVVPVQFTTDKGENIALDVTRVAPITDTEFQHMVKSGDATVGESFNIDRSTFTLFRLQGKIYSRVRNLDTGEISYYPTLNTFSYNNPIAPNTGTVLEQQV